MCWFSDRRLEDRVERLEELVRELSNEVVDLRQACTMRVGDPPAVWSGYYQERRPVMTAIQAVQTLMAHAGIEPKPVQPVSAGVMFVHAKAE
jgi:hypothetical protein